MLITEKLYKHWQKVFLNYCFYGHFLQYLMRIFTSLSFSWRPWQGWLYFLSPWPQPASLWSCSKALRGLKPLYMAFIGKTKVAAVWIDRKEAENGPNIHFEKNSRKCFGKKFRQILMLEIKTPWEVILWINCFKISG